LCEPGRVVVRSPFLARGYADGAAGGFGPDPCPGHRRYDTGDVGRLLPDGRLELLGRDDDQVKIDGFRVEPAELDRALRRRPWVRDCVSLPRPGPDGTRTLVSWVVPAHGAPVAAERVRADLRRELPGYLLPGAVVALPALPLTANGKVDRAALPAPAPPAVPPPGAAPGPVPVPRTAAERTVAAVWAGVLGRPGVDLDANFFDLGGSSLLMVRAQLALQRELSREVPILTLFEYPTVRGLAAHLTGAGDEGAGRVRRRPPAPVTADAGRRLAVRRTIRQEDLS
jgi:acyl carrier protein